MLTIIRGLGAATIGAAIAAVLLLMAPEARAETNVMFIVDASGSMKKAVDGEPRMTAAKRVMAEALANMPPDTRLGLVLYGHRKAKDCTDMELAVPIGSEDSASIAKRIGALNAKGETPIAASLELAAKSFLAFKGQTNSIVLVTDGIEECKGDPCAAASAIRDAGLDLKVNIVGFTLKEEQKKLIQCVSDLTGGTYYDAKDAKALSTALAAVTKKVAEPDDNILAQVNGGTLVAGPNDEWLRLNDGKEEQATTYSGEGIWAFKDGKPATFDSFDVLIPEASQYNLKDFELFAGDEGPLGAFRSLGTFSVQNLKMMKSPYQSFKFPATTARFLKVSMNTDQGGGYISAYEFRLHGKIDAAAEGAAALSAPTGTDLLSRANGGTLVAAPNDEWSKLNDGSEERATTYAGSGVWAFKDGRPATFDRLEVFIDQAYQYNLKDFEIFVGDEGPTGAFRSLGTFTTANTKLMQSPYQAFTFPPATGRFVKIDFKTDWGGGYTTASELRLFGTLDEAGAAAAAAPAAPAAAPAGINLLAQANGGTLLAAPNDAWNKVNDGSEEETTTYSGEGVWAFKDEQPATFDSFEVFIPGSNQYNLKDFELLAGDESPTGSFRSIGTFTVQNTKMMQSPYQRFTFPPVTAKYLKIVLKTDQGGGYITAYEFRLWGQLGAASSDAAAGSTDAPAAMAPAAAPESGGINLLAQSAGGTLLAAPNDEWMKLNDGSEEQATTYGGEGIWAFKDEQPATFDSFEVLIPGTNQYNLKDFELLVADDGPTGTYRSIGSFTTQNIKMMQSPYQKFTFAPVTAKYLKVVLKTDWGGGYISCYEFRLNGKPAQ